MEALILEISTHGLHQYWPIERDITTIGRALDNDIILSEPTVAPYHLKIIRYGDESLELVNLAEVNPARLDGQRIDSLVTARLPLQLEIGRVQAQLLARDHAVPETRPLAGNGRRSHLFGSASWGIALAMLCLVLGGVEFFLSAYNAYQWSDLFKFVLRETVLTIGAFVLALSVLERLLVNRWEVKQVVTSVCLAYLLFYFGTRLADGLVYLFSANWPASLFHFGWYLFLVPCAIALYLVHISHLKNGRSIALAVLIASPIALPSLLQSPELKSLLQDFSNSAQYQNSLSAWNWHLDDRVSIDSFITQAQSLGPGEIAD